MSLSISQNIRNLSLAQNTRGNQVVTVTVEKTEDEDGNEVFVEKLNVSAPDRVSASKMAVKTNRFSIKSADHY
jgi:hypothetical protein